jgi:hypothetical protein
LGVIKFRKRNKNRFRKVYPFLRRKPVYETILEGSANIEVGYIDYSNTDVGTYTFTSTFTSAPIVTATAVETPAGTDANINVYIEAVTTSNVTIRVSDANFIGRVHLHAITAS